MAEYIEREAAVSSIMQKERHDFPADYFPDDEYAFNDGLVVAANALDEVPAADVAPVVRCGECKHCVEHYDTDGNAPYWVCKEWDSGTDYDGYCHHGEKKGRWRRMRLTHYDKHKKRWQINNDYGAVIIDELNYAVGESINKLAAYEDAEEQGLLVRLPCKVGDTVYRIHTKDHIVKNRITDFHVSASGIWYWDETGRETHVERIGKTVFLTYEEAEAALKGERKDV